MTDGELNFVDQYTRSLLPAWADYCIRTGSLPDFESLSKLDLEIKNSSHGPHMHPILVASVQLGIHKVYWDFALEKGWVTKKLPRTLTAAGYKTAAAFLKR